MNGLNTFKCNGYGNGFNNQSYGNFPTTNTSIGNQIQPYTNNLQPTMLPGRIVRSEREIGIQDVPMDGLVHLFPTEDYSCIYVKTWDNSGEFRTFKFVQEDTPVSELEAKVIQYDQKEILDLVNDRFDGLERLIKRNNNNKSYNKNYKKPYNKSNQNGSSNQQGGE